jgi:hypothetical protein
MEREMTANEERAKLCAENIAKILKQFNCTIIPKVEIIGTEVVSSITVVAQDVEIDTDGIKEGE